MSANPLELFTAYLGLNQPATEFAGALRVERRKRARTTVHWPVLLFRNEAAEAVETLTLNLSSGGFYCLSQTSFTPGELLICALTVPTHDPCGKEMERKLECRVRVMRVEADAVEGRFGIACRIEDYRFAQSGNGHAQ